MPKTTVNQTQIQKQVDEILATLIPHFTKKRTPPQGLVFYYCLNVTTKTTTPELPYTYLIPKTFTKDQLFHAYGTGINGTLAYKYKDHCKRVHAGLIAKFTEAIMDKFSEAAKQELRGNIHNVQYLNEYIEKKINEIIGSVDDISDYLTKEFEANADTELLDAIRKIKPQITVRQELIARLSRSVVIEMADNGVNKLPLIALLQEKIENLLPNHRLKTIPVNHPGQLITGIKDKYFIGKDKWKTFIKMSPSVLDSDTRLISILINIDKPKPSAGLKKFFSFTSLDRAIAAVNAELQNHLLTPEHLDKTCENQCTIYEQKLINLYSLCTAAYDVKPTKEQNFAYTCRDMNDYLRDHTAQNNGLYPYHSTWNSLQRATTSWHYAIQRRRAIRSAGNRLLEWNSLLPAQEIDDYNVTPLVNNADLIAEGNVMHHCVGQYWRYAMDNHYRFFHIEHKENLKDVGTLCLTPKDNNSLIMNQLRSTHNASVSPELKKVANKVLIRYRNIYRKTDEELRVWNKTINADNNQLIDVKGYPDRDITLAESFELEIETPEELLIIENAN